MFWIALAAAIGPLIVPASTLDQPDRDQRLRTFLQQRFHNERTNAPDTRYVAAWADLDGDRQPEAIVSLFSSSFCGTGGCTLYVFTGAGSSWRQVSEIMIINAPIRVLMTRSHGWLDLSVQVAGGGGRAFVARLSFNGRRYPGNPSMAPAVRRGTPGRVLITDQDPMRPLF